MVAKISCGNLLMLLILTRFSLAQEKELPKYIKKCSMKHNLRECVIKSANDAIPFIVKGDPKYNVPNMQPLHIPFVSLINTPQLMLNLSNLEISGLDKARMIDFIEDSKQDMHFTLVLAVPSTTIQGDYSVSGRVMILPVKGVGNYSLQLTNGVYKYFHELKIVSIKGENYYQSQGEKLQFSFEKISINLGNLFNGDEILGAQVNKLLNENWNDLAIEFGPGISEVVTKTIQQIFNGIAKKVPAKNVFLSD